MEVVLEPNAVIGDNGEILAVEVVDGGDGYNNSPQIVIDDPTGKLEMVHICKQ